MGSAGLSDSQPSVTRQDSTNDLARSLRHRSDGRRGIRLSGEKDAVAKEQRLTLVGRNGTWVV